MQEPRSILHAVIEDLLQHSKSDVRQRMQNCQANAQSQSIYNAPQLDGRIHIEVAESSNVVVITRLLVQYKAMSSQRIVDQGRALLNARSKSRTKLLALARE